MHLEQIISIIKIVLQGLLSVAVVLGYLSYFSDKYPYPCFIVILL